MLEHILRQQKEYFAKGSTLPVDVRVNNLKKLKRTIYENEDRIINAISTDIGRPATETYTSEIYIVIKEIDLLLKNLKRWAKPIRVKTPPILWPAKSYLQYEPYGTVLILGSWNYPFQLLISPLIGAMAAGNCSVIKPSEVSSNTADVIAEIINGVFDEKYIYTARGGAQTADDLLKLDFDYIFFTGSTQIGRKVMKAAAERIIPFTLELGGKCPCIIDKDADIKKAARRITWAKFFNAGQNCLAPDYLYVHDSVKKPLIKEIKHYLNEFYGADPLESPDYGRIIDNRHFDRIINILKKSNLKNIRTDRENLYIAPTIIEEASWEDELMKEEIFGPLLPILSYERFQDAINSINKGYKPLSIYLFTSNKNTIDTVLKETSSGGVTVNDVLLQAVSNYLPFGGVGSSGVGRYRGKSSFTAFSNQKSIMLRGLSLDWNFRYPPYKIKLKSLKKFLKHL
jgi:aldehyde dehydrogenase (NAD+)